jgi:hypothetical protein
MFHSATAEQTAAAGSLHGIHTIEDIMRKRVDRRGHMDHDVTFAMRTYTFFAGVLILNFKDVSIGTLNTNSHPATPSKKSCEALTRLARWNSKTCNSRGLINISKWKARLSLLPL